MGKTIRRAVASVVTGVLLATGVVLGVAAPAQAADPANFNPGYIISDQRFFDSSSMTEAQIQAFLNQALPTCVAANGIPCLKNYTAATFSRPAVKAGHCYAYQSEGVETAARIILKVAKACNINPQVLLATLQKEQGLITAKSPTERQYRVAMGYGCPDTAPCDAQYYGFYNQVYKAAWQFRQYTFSPSTWRYKIGQVAVQYHPNAACGAPTVRILNQATANLYNYTPYQPNAAALANLGGVGDACSSYGNRNFWRYFTDWFGSTTGQTSPIGSIDSVTPVPGGIQVRGWALDPDMTGVGQSTQPIDVHVYYGGKGVAYTANGTRADVGKIYPGAGAKHGFDVFFPAAGAVSGPLCVYGINAGPGANSALGCITVSTRSGAPTGSLDYVRTSVGKVTVGGWALDPDTAASVRIDLYVGNVKGYSFTANTTRTDVSTTFPGYGVAHGFAQTVVAPAGTHNVCAYAINVGPGSHKLLGCVTATVPADLTDTGRAPIGALDSAKGVAGGISLAGWTIDPDTTKSIQVHAYVDGSGSAIAANQARSDIATTFPVYGANHGFNSVVTASPGKHTVCVYGINTGAGGHTNFGCRTVTVPQLPVGSLDSVTSTAAGYAVSGWAIDPDTAQPINVHVYVDNSATALSASQSRADVGKAYPVYGPNHGFTATIPASKGSHTVCAYAIDNVTSSYNTPLGCRVVTLQ